MSSTKYGSFERFILEQARLGLELTVVHNGKPSSEEYINDLKTLNVHLCIVNGNFFKRLLLTVRIIEKTKADIIHYNFGLLVYFLFLYIKVFHPHTKQILTQHCEYLYANKFMVLLSRFCYKSLDLVISVSKGVNNELISKLGYCKTFIVSYLGVAKRSIINPNIRNDWNIPEKYIVITSIGFDIYVKGFDLLAKAVSLLLKRDRIPDFKIVIIGLSREEELKYKELLLQLHVESYFVLPGIRNDIDDFLNITDIYVQSSRTEAISLSIMEALMYSLPIIGANVGGIPEVCRDNINGLLFERENPLDLAGKLEKMILNVELRNAYGKASSTLSENFNVECNAKKLISIYKSLV